MASQEHPGKGAARQGDNTQLSANAADSDTFYARSGASPPVRLPLTQTRLRKLAAWRTKLMEHDPHGLILVYAVVDPFDSTTFHTLGPCPLCGRVVKFDKPRPYVAAHSHGQPDVVPPQPGMSEGRAGHCVTGISYSIIKVVSLEEAIKLAPRGYMTATQARTSLMRETVLDLRYGKRKPVDVYTVAGALRARRFLATDMWSHEATTRSVERLLKQMTDEGLLERVLVADEYGFGKKKQMWRRA
jgi:hypothetical protein